MLLQVPIGDKFTLGEGGTGVGGAKHLQSLGGLVTAVLPNVLIAANIVLFFLILLGGFMLIANAGNADKQAQGSKIMTSAIVGFLIVFGAYWILQILGIITGYGFLETGAGAIP